MSITVISSSRVKPAVCRRLEEDSLKIEDRRLETGDLLFFGFVVIINRL